MGFHSGTRLRSRGRIAQLLGNRRLSRPTVVRSIFLVILPNCAEKCILFDGVMAKIAEACGLALVK
jgi:hypothetical protein